MQRPALDHLGYILGSLSRWGQVAMAPPAWEQVFVLSVRDRTLKSSARSRISAADVADATAATARSAAATTDTRNAAAATAGSATTGGATGDAAATTARSATTGGATRDGAAATAGAWCCGWRGRNAGRRGGRWRGATAWPLIATAATSNRQDEHGCTAEKRDGSSGFGSHQIPHSPLAPHSSSPPVRTPAYLGANRI
jgi:hypothetical protein